MRKKEQSPRGRRDWRSRLLSGSHVDEQTSVPAAAATEELTIELLEERLTPGYPARILKKTAGWGC